MARHRVTRAKLHAWRPSVLLPESLEDRIAKRCASCPFGAGMRPVSPEFIRAVVAGPERLRALRLRQRASRFFHRAGDYTGRRRRFRATWLQSGGRPRSRMKPTDATPDAASLAADPLF